MDFKLGFAEHYGLRIIGLSTKQEFLAQEKRYLGESHDLGFWTDEGFYRVVAE
jgi:hypothetical protein